MSIEEVQQLQLKGVTVVGGRITGLNLSVHDLSGTSATTSGCSRILICEWSGPIPKEIGLLTALKRCDLSSNELSGLLDIASDVHAF
jgi:hypothetical protein